MNRIRRGALSIFYLSPGPPVIFLATVQYKNSPVINANAPFQAPNSEAEGMISASCNHENTANIIPNAEIINQNTNKFSRFSEFNPLTLSLGPPLEINV